MQLQKNIPVVASTIVVFFSIPYVNVYAQSSSAIQILSNSSFTDSLGYMHIVGELKNTSSDSRRFVEITASLYDTNNKIVDTSFAYSSIDVIRPGELSPFEIIFTEQQQIAQATSYKLAITSQIAKNSKPAQLQLHQGTAYTDSIGFYHVVGEITNVGDFTTKYVEVTGTFYDGQGKVIATSFTFTQPSDLEPQQTAPFEMIVTAPTVDQIVKYSLNAQSSEYSSMIVSTTDDTSATDQQAEAAEEEAKYDLSEQYLRLSISDDGYPIRFSEVEKQFFRLLSETDTTELSQMHLKYTNDLTNCLNEKQHFNDCYAGMRSTYWIGYYLAVKTDNHTLGLLNELNRFTYEYQACTERISGLAEVDPTAVDKLSCDMLQYAIDGIQMAVKNL